MKKSEGAEGKGTKKNTVFASIAFVRAARRNAPNAFPFTLTSIVEQYSSLSLSLSLPLCFDPPHANVINFQSNNA